jgi:ABC-type uncharacterized transport system permease subunit
LPSKTTQDIQNSTDLNEIVMGEALILILRGLSVFINSLIYGRNPYVGIPPLIPDIGST